MLILVLVFAAATRMVASSCTQDITPALEVYRDRLEEKCSATPAPVIGPSQVVPLLDYFIENLIKKTPEALHGKLPDGSPELLEKTRSVMESHPAVDLCTESGIESVKETLMPVVVDSLIPLKLSFDRNCPVYRSWLKTEEGDAFLVGLNAVVEKMFE